jgi:hypothetical protein
VSVYYHVELCPSCGYRPPSEEMAIPSTFTFQIDPKNKKIDYYVYPHRDDCPVLKGLRT